jgi:glycerol-3-phosphate dehydrogenase
MKLWILIIATTHGQTTFGTKFTSYKQCNEEAVKIVSKFLHAVPACRKERPFTP